MLQLGGAIASKKTAFRKKTTTKEQLWWVGKAIAKPKN